MKGTETPRRDGIDDLRQNQRRDQRRNDGAHNGYNNAQRKPFLLFHGVKDYISDHSFLFHDSLPPFSSGSSKSSRYSGTSRSRFS